MYENDVIIDSDTEFDIKDLESRGKTVILLAINNILTFLIKLDNKSNLRPEGINLI